MVFVHCGSNFEAYMSQNLKFFLFITGILLAIDFYTWQGVKFLSTSLTERSRDGIKYIYWGYTGLSFLFFLTWRMGWMQVSPGIQKFVLTIVFVIFLAKIIWCIFLLVDDVVRLFKWIVGKFQSQTPGSNEQVSGISRMKFLNYMGLGIGATFMTSAVYGITRGAHNYQVKRRTLKIKGLPEAFEGMTIVQISDVHSGSFWNHDAVKKGVELLNKQQADMVFFTGDLVNDVAGEMEPWKAMFSTIKAPMGVFSILGNHDYGDYFQWNDKNPNQQIGPQPDKSHMSIKQKENLQKLIGTHKELGWDLLLDEHRIIEKNGSKMAIIGVENWSAKVRFPKYGDLSKAYQGAENADVKLLLSHDPSHWKAEVLTDYPDIDATFSGHTHGMQFGIDSSHYRWSPVKFIYPEWIDLYSQGNQLLYVNRGFGYLGFPGRIGIFPEISVFTLRKA